MLDTYLIIFITLVAALIASLSQLLFKKSMHGSIKGIKGLLRIARERNLLIGVMGYLASFGIYLFALDNAPLSFVYPVFASTFVFVFLFSVLMLHEKFSRVRALGIAFIIAGIVIISFTL